MLLNFLVKIWSEKQTSEITVFYSKNQESILVGNNLGNLVFRGKPCRNLGEEMKTGNIS